jgi:hypothetical protein
MTDVVSSMWAELEAIKIENDLLQRKLDIVMEIAQIYANEYGRDLQDYIDKKMEEYKNE